MWRIIFLASAGVSLAAFFATAVLWVRGHYVYDDYMRWSGPTGSDLVGDYYTIYSISGKIFFISEKVTDPSRRPWVPLLVAGRPWVPPPASDWNKLGFWNSTERDPPAQVPQSVRRFIGVPDWLVLAAAGVLPALAYVSASRRWRKRYRLLHGLCAKCGYDLRATPDRCPECGTVVDKPKPPPG
jgi:predicted Zn-ribbon and HTH transcriptional regulator